jgi:hypothetical protein
MLIGDPMSISNAMDSPRGELDIEEIQAVLEEPFDSLQEELLSSPEAMADVDEKPKSASPTSKLGKGRS